MLKRRLKEAIVKNFTDILYCLFLLLIAFKFTYSLESVRDIELHDESFFLYHGVKILELGILPASWSPLYSIWYFCLSWFQNNNIALFYLNFKLLIFTTSYLFYIYLRTLKIRSLIAIIFGFIYSISTISLLTPRSGNFSVLIVLSFLVIANCMENNTIFYFLTTLAFLLVAFVRPEYTISFLIFLFIYILLIINSIFSKNINLKNVVFQLSILISSIGFFLLQIGNPLAGNRSFVAFSQHFAWLWMDRNNITNPHVEYYKVIIQSIFGDVNSISQAIIANPRAFLIHTIVNFISYIHHSTSILLVNLQNDFATSVNISIRYFEILLFLIIILTILARYKIFLARINYTISKRLLMISVALFIPIFASSIIINPRFHYLILQSIFLLTIIAYCLENSLPLSIQNRKHKLLYPIIIGFFLLLLTPNLARGWCLTENFCIIQRIFIPETSTLPNLKTIKFIQSLQIKNEVNILEAEGGYYIYLGDLYHYIPEAKKQENFSRFLQKEKINMVIFSPTLENDLKFAEDEEFIAFISQPEQWGFVKLKIPKTNAVLFLTSELIESKNIQKNRRIK